MQLRWSGVRKFVVRVVPHILFWVVILSVYTFLYGHRNGAYLSVLLILIYTLPVYLGATYFTLYFLIPRFLLTRRYKKFAVYFIYTSLLTIFLEILILIYGVIMPPAPEGAWFRPVDPASVDIFFLLAGIYGVLILAAAIKLLKYSYESQQKAKQLSTEKLEAELNYLKSQIHPHFLFNTLNNLYALTLKKSDQAPDMVMKLSELLDYMIYQSNADRVSLEQEIHMLRNYISLEQMRYGDDLEIRFEVSGDPDGKEIAPLLILPFVENSFKHGISKQAAHSWIRIAMDISETGMSLSIENSKPVYLQHKCGDHHGIGLENVRKRLELMYPESHELHIDDRPESYRVNFELQWDTKEKRWQAQRSV